MAYFNTTSQEGESLRRKQRRADSQDSQVLDYLKKNAHRDFTAFELRQIFPFSTWGYPSPGRALTNLFNNKEIVKTESKRPGGFLAHDNCAYQYKEEEKQVQLTQQNLFDSAA